MVIKWLFTKGKTTKSYLCVLRDKKKPKSFRAYNRINWLSDVNNLNTVRTPFFTSNAGTMELGCSDIKLISICSTSFKFSSYKTIGTH